jgi:hypothetical protein
MGKRGFGGEKPPIPYRQFAMPLGLAEYDGRKERRGLYGERV